MKERIFQDLKEKKLDVGYIWSFHDCLQFQRSLNPKEKKMFHECIKELVNSGFFNAERVGEGAYDYRLTQKGFDELYNDD